MTVIASPPPLPASFGHANSHSAHVGPSNLQNNYFPARSSHQLLNGISASHGQNGPQDSTGKQRLINGHTARNIATAGGTHNISPEQQEPIRSRTESQKLANRPRGQLTRTQTDFGSKHQAHSSRDGPAEEVGELRHGWEDQYNSSEFLGLLSSVSPLVHFIRSLMCRLSDSSQITDFLHVFYR